MDSTHSDADLELIAALLDGRLSGEERARAVKLLADSDDALEVFASTLRDQPAVSDVKVVPISTARRWRQWRVIVPVAAAAMLAIVVVPKLTGRGAQAGLAKAYATQLTQDPSFAGGLRSGWDQRWAASRGGAAQHETAGTRPASSALESRLAFRLGVRSVDLQIALQRRDTVLARGLINEVVETLKDVSFSELVGASYTELGSSLSTETPAQSIDRASAAEHELRGLLGSSLVGVFEFGEWASAAELAAQTHDAAFFTSGRGKSPVRSAGPTGSLLPEDAEALGTIDARVKKGLDDRALNEVDEVLVSIIRRRGG